MNSNPGSTAVSQRCVFVCVCVSVCVCGHTTQSLSPPALLTCMCLHREPQGCGNECLPLFSFFLFFTLTSFKGQNSARKCRERTSNTSWILSCLFDSYVHWLASAGRGVLPREMHLHHRLGPKYRCKYQVTTQGEGVWHCSCHSTASVTPLE